MNGRNLKTAKMLLLEATDPEKRTIQQIILSAYRHEHTQRRAARKLGISNTLLSTWIYRLNIQSQILRVINSETKCHTKEVAHTSAVGLDIPGIIDNAAEKYEGELAEAIHA